MNYVVEEWMKENALAVESGIRSEIVEDFMVGLRNLFVENNLDIPEDKVNVVEELSTKVSTLESALSDQIQENADTVQGALNNALQIILRSATIETFGASRTDEGVHAHYNVYHFDWPIVLDKTIPYKLNALLPSAMACVGFYKTNTELNARFDAITRQYRYIIYNKKNPFLDKRAYFYPFQLAIDQLHETSKILKEHTDFETFSMFF
mgnify:CR=1 FL=1